MNAVSGQAFISFSMIYQKQGALNKQTFPQAFTLGTCFGLSVDITPTKTTTSLCNLVFLGNGYRGLLSVGLIAHTTILHVSVLLVRSIQSFCFLGMYLN